MQELIKKLMDDVGLSSEQAEKAMNSVKEFVSSKLPTGFSLDGILGNMKEAGANIIDKADDMADAAKDKIAGLHLGDKVELAKDKLGDMAEAAEDKLEDIADKAEDMAKNAINKLKGMFGGGNDEAK